MVGPEPVRALEELCVKHDEAEREWQAAEQATARAFSAELIGRAELVRCMEKNEGSRSVTFPGQKRRVRQSFMRSPRGKASDNAGEDGEEATDA